MSLKVSKYFALLTFLLVVCINALANILPIGGITTGAVSDSYPNLFAPSAFTFSIWGLIYLLLAIYTIYQFKSKEAFTREINIYFGLSSILNSVWIFAWHYKVIWLTWILMIGILICLIMINTITMRPFNNLKQCFINRRTFEIYFGWISVATIANTVTLLVSIGWHETVDEAFWLTIILIVSAIIGKLTIIRRKAPFYGLVFVWAYFGIADKLKNIGGLNFQVYLIYIIMILMILTIGFASKKVLEEQKNW